jgi:hypothetical protein
MIFHVVVFPFAFFQIVLIFVDFQIPLGTQLVQNGMKMVPTTDPLGCFLIQFRPTKAIPKPGTQHNKFKENTLTSYLFNT